MRQKVSMAWSTTLRRHALATLCAALAIRSMVDAGAAAYDNSGGAASGREAARTIRVRVSGASGLFSKTFSVRGRRMGEVQERELASVRYGGLGRSVSSTDWLVLQNVSAVYLQMDIDPQFALPGIRLHLRSDDPATSHYLFHKVGERWEQVPRGAGIDVFSYAGCGLRDFSWEDGGDFQHQDFFFEVDAGPDCVLISRGPEDRAGVSLAFLP